MMAAALVMLAAARLPVLVRKGKDTVFAAAVFACGAALLTNPVVYQVVDRALGGFNLARLIMMALMILGLWFLRKGILRAVAPDADRGRLKALPVYVALALTLALFLLIDPSPTSITWGDDHEGTLVGALFSVTGIGFISWCCGEIALVCMAYVPRMSGIFRPGFCMVGAGCGIGCLSMAWLAITVLSHPVPWIEKLTVVSPDGFRILELTSIALVGIGLTMTAVAGHRRRLRMARWEKEALAQIEPIRERVLLKAGLQRTLESDPDAHVQDRLHRLLVEIWDAQLAAGPNVDVLAPAERVFLMSVEQKLDLDQNAR